MRTVWKVVREYKWRLISAFVRPNSKYSLEYSTEYWTHAAIGRILVFADTKSAYLFFADSLLGKKRGSIPKDMCLKWFKAQTKSIPKPIICLPNPIHTYAFKTYWNSCPDGFFFSKGQRFSSTPMGTCGVSELKLLERIPFKE